MAAPAHRAIDRLRTGAAAEQIAARYLADRGLEILLRNYRRRLGELDVIARDGDVLLIVEVRTRASDAYGGAAASVNAAKQRRIVRTAAALLRRHADLASFRVRFDVIVVREPHSAQPAVEWLRGAFDAPA